MYSYFDKSLTEFTYLIERISIVTKEFLNKLNRNDKLYDMIHEIYKSNQAINYEFIKLCYNLRSDGKINMDIPNISKIDIEIKDIKTISEYQKFILNSSNSIITSLNLICKSFNKYSNNLNEEIIKFEELINKLESNKLS